MDIFKKKTEIELAIWNIDRNYKVPTETIVSTINNIHLNEFPDNDEYEEDDEKEGYDHLSFNYHKSPNGGIIFIISRDIADISDKYEVKVELIFEGVKYPDGIGRVYGDYDTFLEDVLQDPLYNIIKDLIPNQFKVRTKTGPF
jgi:hypothetical protein